MGQRKKPPGSTFIEGFDSYSDQYREWAKTTIVKRLVGIYQVPKAQFCQHVDELLASVGLGDYSVVVYQTQHDSSQRGDEPIVGTGFTVAVRNVYGKTVPVVFVRDDVGPVAGETDNEQTPQFADSVRLLVLLHELGHADDISKGINYDHAALTIDFAGAEAYAHAFVCKHAQRNNYARLLGTYLEDVRRMAESDHDALRVGAERFLRDADVEKMQAWVAERKTVAGMKKYVEQIGRLEEIAQNIDSLDG